MQFWHKRTKAELPHENQYQCASTQSFHLQIYKWNIQTPVPKRSFLPCLVCLASPSIYFSVCLYIHPSVHPSGASHRHTRVQLCSLYDGQLAHTLDSSSFDKLRLHIWILSMADFKMTKTKNRVMSFCSRLQWSLFVLSALTAQLEGPKQSSDAYTIYRWRTAVAENQYWT